MSHKDSMRRRRGLTHQWKGTDFLPIIERFSEIGAENAIVELKMGTDERGRPQPWMRVRDARVQAASHGGDTGWTNVSHPCPPDCL